MCTPRGTFTCFRQCSVIFVLFVFLSTTLEGTPTALLSPITDLPKGATNSFGSVVIKPETEVMEHFSHRVETVIAENQNTSTNSEQGEGGKRLKQENGYSLVHLKWEKSAEFVEFGGTPEVPDLNLTISPTKLISSSSSNPDPKSPIELDVDPQFFSQFLAGTSPNKSSPTRRFDLNVAPELSADHSPTNSDQNPMNRVDYCRKRKLKELDREDGKWLNLVYLVIELTLLPIPEVDHHLFYREGALRGFIVEKGAYRIGCALIDFNSSLTTQGISGMIMSLKQFDHRMCRLEKICKETHNKLSHKLDVLAGLNHPTEVTLAQRLRNLDFYAHFYQRLRTTLGELGTRVQGGHAELKAVWRNAMRFLTETELTLRQQIKFANIKRNWKNADFVLNELRREFCKNSTKRSLSPPKGPHNDH